MNPQPPPGDIGDVLVTQEEIAARVAALGAEISRDYADKNPLVVGVLKGSVVFVADLVRAITVPVTMDFLGVVSYGEATKSSGVVKIIKDLDQDVTGRDVLIVEDIVDSGLTLAYLLDYLGGRRLASLKSCALLLRSVPDATGRVDAPVDYVGFEVPSDAFVVGYGLDVAQQYRNLPYLAEYQLEDDPT